MAFGRGKVILLGEHAVVYGRPALAAGIERGVEATARGAEEDKLLITPWGAEVTPHGSSGDALARALAALLETFGPARPTVEISARVDLPGGAGLGCSAALSVAIVGAVDELLGVERTAEERARRALAGERIFHGNPSGIDTAVSASGGVVLFQREAPLERVRAGRSIRLVVGHSGEAASTKSLVDVVARQYDRAPERLDKTFDAVATIVRNGRLALGAGDLRALGQLMDLNQAMLSSLLVSTGRLEELCGAARDAGALGAKLTGAGEAAA